MEYVVHSASKMQRMVYAPTLSENCTIRYLDELCSNVVNQT